jgi:predicted ATP-grasp superfamily ATP-dependent carboligase
MSDNLLSKKTERVLLTDGQQRKTLAAVRSLGRRGVEVNAAEKTSWATALYSKYCSKSLKSPDPVKFPVGYLAWLEAVLAWQSIDVFIPMDDGSMEVAVRYQKRLGKYCKLLVPREESYIRALDKGLAVKAASEAGLDVPKTIAPDSLEDLEDQTSGLSFPVVIKPRKSSGSRGITLVRKIEDLAEYYTRIHKKYPFPLIQEYIAPGEKYDVCLLYDNCGCLRASFVQKEVRCFPLEMGPSTVQESVFRPDLIRKADKLMQNLKWQGVAEVEFMIDSKTGRAVFMEINPRFWASLHTAILAGVDFPWLLFQLTKGDEIKDVFEYREGIRCRWLLPGDILHFIYNKNRFSMEPPFLNPAGFPLYDDIISKEDPMPILGFILACFRYSLDPAMWKLIFKR